MTDKLTIAHAHLDSSPHDTFKPYSYANGLESDPNSYTHKQGSQLFSRWYQTAVPHLEHNTAAQETPLFNSNPYAPSATSQGSEQGLKFDVDTLAENRVHKPPILTPLPDGGSILEFEGRSGRENALLRQDNQGFYYDFLKSKTYDVFPGLTDEMKFHLNTIMDPETLLSNAVIKLLELVWRNEHATLDQAIGVARGNPSKANRLNLFMYYGRSADNSDAAELAERKNTAAFQSKVLNNPSVFIDDSVQSQSILYDSVGEYVRVANGGNPLKFLGISSHGDPNRVYTPDRYGVPPGNIVKELVERKLLATNGTITFWGCDIAGTKSARNALQNAANQYNVTIISRSGDQTAVGNDLGVRYVFFPEKLKN